MSSLNRAVPARRDGTVWRHGQVPVLKRVWEQMCEPKWSIAFGVCASSGGFYDNYSVVQGIDNIIPVDIYIPACSGGFCDELFRTREY